MIAVIATTAAMLVGVPSGASVQPSSETPVYVSRAGVDTNPGTARAPVATFGRAYRLVRPGGVVEVAGGSYGYQRLARDYSKRSSKRVVFRPTAGAKVELTVLDFGQEQFDVLGPKHISVQDMTIDYVRAWRGARHLVWRNIQAKHFDIFDASYVTIAGGDYGPCRSPLDDPACVPRIAGHASNILLDGVSIHGMTSADLETYHIDGLFIRGGNNIVVRNSKFWGNMVTNVRIQDQGCCTNRNILIENNWFDSSLQGDGVTPRWNAIDVDNGMDGLVIRNNSFVESGLLLIGTYRRSRVVNNLLENMGCGNGVKYSRNLFVPFSPYTGLRACSSSDRRVRSLGYVNGAAFDLRLRPQAPGFAAGDPLDCPTVDILGRARLRGLKCDAGAYERQDAWVCHRSKTRGLLRAMTLRVGLTSVPRRLRRGDTMGKCGSR